VAKHNRETRSLLQALDKLETLINLAKNEYEMYFMGVIRKPPEGKHREIKLTIHELMQMNLTNTAVKFKLRVLRTRFNSLSMRWLRTVKQIEDGTYKKHRWLADRREAERRKKGPTQSVAEIRAEIQALVRGEDPGKAAAPPPTPDRCAPSADRRVARGHAVGSDGLFDAYVSSRQTSGEGGPVNRTALEATLKKHAALIKKKYGARDVRFKVVNEGGKTRVKAIPVK
jgi:hypothetical protein